MCILQVKPNFTEETMVRVNMQLDLLKDANDPIATAQSINSITRTLNDPSIQTIVPQTDRRKVCVCTICTFLTFTTEKISKLSSMCYYVVFHNLLM